jgi:hypothetical protein
MSANIILVFGTFARECAQAIASTNAIAIASDAFGCWGAFEPLAPVIIHAPDRGSLMQWHRKAAAVLEAGPRDAVVRGGRFRGAGRGKTIQWRRAK